MDEKEFLKQKNEIEKSEAKHKVAKLTSSLLPGGTTAYETFVALVQPLHEKRKDEWLHKLMYDLVQREEEAAISLQTLSENEEFNTIVTKATVLAQQNHEEEKLEAFRNIVLNSTEWLHKGKPIFDWSHKFLMIVDQISPLHILLLKTFQYPADVARKHEADLNDMVTATNKEVFFKIFPDLKDRAALAAQCWKELYSFGFVVRDSFDNKFEEEDMRLMHAHGKLIPQTTDFGNKFLGMIEREEEA